MSKKENVQDYFSNHAADWVQGGYDGNTYLYPTALHRAQVVCDILSDLAPQSRIVDVGCGGGHLALRLAALGHSVNAIDQSAEMIALAKAQKEALAAETPQDVTFHVAELETPPELPAHDALTCMGVIGYLDTDTPFFTTAGKLLKDDGTLLVSCRNRLFNMVSYSHRTQNEISQGGASSLVDALIRSTAAVPPGRIRELADNLVRTGEALKDLLDGIPDDQPFDVPPPKGPDIEARQHTPDELVAEAGKHGFTLTALHGVHPHLLPPHVSRFLPPQTYNLLSSSLESLHDLPISLSWSSVFVAVFRKSA